MLNEHIQFKGAGAIARARFNRLEKKNAITESMFDNLREAIEKSEAEADPAVRILVVASTGDNFTDFTHSSPSGRESSAGRLLRTLWSERTAATAPRSSSLIHPQTAGNRDKETP
jgi:hypothetical protein